MIRRIMSRAQIALVWEEDHKRRNSDKTFDINDGFYERRKQAEIDLMFHLLADGKDVIVRNSIEHGGTVVEIAE